MKSRIAVPCIMDTSIIFNSYTIVAITEATNRETSPEAVLCSRNRKRSTVGACLFHVVDSWRLKEKLQKVSYKHIFFRQMWSSQSLDLGVHVLFVVMRTIFFGELASNFRSHTILGLWLYGQLDRSAFCSHVGRI